ncbi:hypothetical protein J3Q64DRAFT_1765176 [Phycomyces blakesleeanus]|uniref:Secreted protein n=1 Tax=Phycomyces blakesleeanus TaxID=4837 RepID=A0ABR3APF6_PHYBL
MFCFVLFFYWWVRCTTIGTGSIWTTSSVRFKYLFVHLCDFTYFLMPIDVQICIMEIAQCSQGSIYQLIAILYAI